MASGPLVLPVASAGPEVILPSTGSLVVMGGLLLVLAGLGLALLRKAAATSGKGGVASVPPGWRVGFRIRVACAAFIGMAVYGWATASPAIVRDERIEPVRVLFVVVGLPMSVWTL